jgi:hypothetical protein
MGPIEDGRKNDMNYTQRANEWMHEMRHECMIDKPNQGQRIDQYDQDLKAKHHRGLQCVMPWNKMRHFMHQCPTKRTDQLVCGKNQ